MTMAYGLAQWVVAGIASEDPQSFHRLSLVPFLFGEDNLDGILDQENHLRVDPEKMQPLR